MVNIYKNLKYKSFNKDFLNLIKKNKDRKVIIENKGLDEFNVTYKELYDLIVRFNNFLQKNKIKRRNTIIVYLPNSTENIIIFRHGILFFLII